MLVFILRFLLRRRSYKIRKRAEPMTHLQILSTQYSFAPFPKEFLRRQPRGNERAKT